MQTGNESLTSNGNSEHLMTITAQFVSAYAGKAKLKVSDLEGVIREVARALSSAEARARTVKVELQQPEPAVPIKKSINGDFLICLEDGKKLKLLKRYLMAAYRMTPDEYRAKWNLPRDYPMIAPNYAKKRSEISKLLGLGKIQKSPGALTLIELPHETPAPPEEQAGGTPQAS